MVQGTDGAFLCGQLAKATGVSAATIRHYERIGVLAKAIRTTSGYRLYPASAVDRVFVVQRALCIGFTLAELADVFKVRDGGGTPCHRVFELAQAKLVGIDAEIAALKQTRGDLIKVLADWRKRLNMSSGQRVHLLQSLSDGVRESRHPKRRTRQ